MNKRVFKSIAIAAVISCFCGNVCFADYDVTVNNVEKTESGFNVTVTSNSGAEANIFAVSRDEKGALKEAEVKQAVKLNAGEQTVIQLSEISGFEKLYIWNDNLEPLSEIYSYSNNNSDNDGENDGENTGDGIIHLMGDSINADGIENVSVDGTVVTINAAGEYIIDGTLNDGQIVVSENLTKDDKVSITLNGVSVTSSNSAPFNGAGGSIELVLTEGTENIFNDSAKYTGYTSEKEPKGCVYSRRDLDIGGDGVLTVNGNVKNGIVCGADLKLKKGANVNVTAVNNAIKGDNGVEFTKKTGTVTVKATDGDAVKSDAIDSDTGLLEQDKGYVTIAGGSITLESVNGDGIQADNYCEISGGEINIKSGAEGIKANEVNVLASVDDIAAVDENGNPIVINGRIAISGGSVDIVSGEDGIKACENVTISGDAVVTITAEGINSEGNSGYDGIQVGESEDTTSEDGLTVTRKVIVPGEINITGGTLNIINATDDAIVSKGKLTISGGKVTGHSECDFIKVYDNIEISGGEINITADCDGIQSGKALIETVSGNEVTESGYTDGNINITGGTFNIVTNGGNKTTASVNDESCKGVKSNTAMNISGGEFNIDSADDSLHSNYNLTITGGSFELASGDDGVHADYMLTLGAEDGYDSDFDINISTSYEGIEGSVINILSGTLYLYATDDGINAAGDYNEDGTLNSSSSGSSSSSSSSNRPGGSGGFGPNQGGDDSSPCGMVYIKGGRTYVEAYGDGLDSNGSIEMSDGIVIVNGPTSGGNGVFDIGDGSGCYFNVTGGTLIGEGTSDMQITVNVTGQGYVKAGSSSSGGGQRPGSSTSTSSSSGSAGSPIKVELDNGNIVFIPKLNWGYMFITTPEMTENSTYSISQISSYSGGEQVFGRNVNNVFYGLVKDAQ